MKSVGETLNEHRNWILKGEICSLFHDLGKLSKAFLEYRATWQADPDGWDKDPHEKGFLVQPEDEKGVPIKDKNGKPFGPHETISSPIVDLLKEAQKVTVCGNEVELQPAEIMNTHCKPRPDNVFEQCLKAADGIDSAQDRNNPLFSNEQKYKEYTYRSNVFGFESAETKVLWSKMETDREALYQELNREDLFKTYWTADLSTCDVNTQTKRREIYDLLRRYFESACSDTTRPQNDTSLWEHTYAVASLTKAMQVYYLLYGGDNTDGSIGEYIKGVAESKWFTIWGFGWDAVEFIGRGQKIHDLNARRHLLHQVQDAAREIVEFEYAIGNHIYRDDSSLLFLVPTVIADSQGGPKYENLLTEIEQSVLRNALELTNGELWPKFAALGKYEEGGLIPKKGERWGRTNRTTHIVEALHNLRRLRRRMVLADGVHVTGDLRSTGTGAEDLWKWIGCPSKIEKDLCPICRLRPDEGNEDKLCTKCLDRRVRRAKDEREEHAEGKRLGTSMMAEIADRNGRVALIVGRIGLDNWLHGDTVRSLFVTEAHGLSEEVNNLGKTVQFAGDEGAAHAVLKAIYSGTAAKLDYERISQQIRACYRAAAEKNKLSPDELKEANASIFLYDRRIVGDPPGLNRDALKHRWADLLRDSTSPDIAELVNLLIAKTPTPSTILDVWMTTEEFFQSLCRGRRNEEGADSKPVIGHEVGERSRVGYSASLEGQRSARPPSECALYTGKIDSERIEFWIEYVNGEDEPSGPVVYFLSKLRGDKSGESRASETVAPDFSEKRINDIRGDQGRRWNGSITCLKARPPEPFYPMREIMATPDIFLALVPADKAIPATRAIVDEFKKRFGKAWGRIPFSMGNLFFGQHEPMFIVLDAARRMLRNFRRLDPQRKSDTDWSSPLANIDAWTAHRSGTSISLKSETGLELAEIPTALGDGKKDYFHPYLMVSKADRKRPSYQLTPVGDVLHWDDLRDSDTVSLVKSYYDWEYLDSSAARFRLNYEPRELKRRNAALNGARTRPIRIEALTQHVEKTWKILRASGVSDSGLRDMIALLWAKLQEWAVTLPLASTAGTGESLAESEWRHLVEQQIKVRFSHLKDDKCEFLAEQIFSGLFFETLTLYLQVLKERMPDRGDAEKEKGSEQQHESVRAEEALAVGAGSAPRR